MRTRFFRTLVVLVASLVMAAAPSQAEEFFLSRTFYGYALVGVSGWCYKEAYDARQDANDFRKQYRRAETDARAQELFDENKRFDTRAILMMGLGTGSLLYAVHLIRSGDKEKLPPPELDTALMQVKGIKVDIAGDLVNRGIALRLAKDFGGKSKQ